GARVLDGPGDYGRRERDVGPLFRDRRLGESRLGWLGGRRRYRRLRRLGRLLRPGVFAGFIAGVGRLRVYAQTREQQPGDSECDETESRLFTAPQLDPHRLVGTCVDDRSTVGR